MKNLCSDTESISAGWGEDDGGRHDVITYKYETLEVDAVRGRVDRIFTNSHHESTSSGITPGQTMSKVVEILGRRPRRWVPARKSFYIVKCPVDGIWAGEDYLTLQFDSDEILTSIEYAVSRP